MKPVSYFMWRTGTDLSDCRSCGLWWDNSMQSYTLPVSPLLPRLTPCQSPLLWSGKYLRCSPGSGGGSSEYIIWETKIWDLSISKSLHPVPSTSTVTVVTPSSVSMQPNNVQLLVYCQQTTAIYNQHQWPVYYLK